MNKKNTGVFILLISISSIIRAQEIQARLSVITSKISTQIDKKVFQTLQTSLTNFINNRRWTNDAFQPSEKIQCNFLLNLEEDRGNNVFKGKLTVQAARPIYNTTYDSPIINFLDDNIVFRYQEFQPIEFNENRIQGNDPIAANLPAVFAYYIDLILGFDYDSYSPRGGDAYFQKAWNIVNNAPEGGAIKGWKQFDGSRNRYFLSENLNNSRYALMHDAIYAYYRNGLDAFYQNEDEGRSGILNCLNFLNTLNTESPNSMVLQFFFQGKSNEMIKIFSKASPDMKKRASDLLVKLDITKASAYKDMK